MVTSCWLPRFPTSSEHIKTFKIIKHQILSSWCDMSFLMWSIWSKLSLLHLDSFHVWAFPTGPRCWHISKAMWRCWLSLVKLVEHWVLMDRIHPTNRTLLGVGSGILVSQSNEKILQRKKRKKGKHSCIAGEQGRHLVSRTACGAKPEGFVMVTSEAKGETSPSYQAKRCCTLPSVFWQIYFTTLMLVEEKGSF